MILIDEPGSYLHSRAQADILKVFESKIAEEHQVIFSTHSSDLIDAKRLNRVRLVLNKQGLGTKVRKTTSREPGDEDFADALSPIVAAIGKDLGKQFDIAAKRNVIVEGPSDFYYLSCLRDKPDYRIAQDIKFVPMSGVFKIEYMASLMIGWGLDFVIIMDRDENSQKEYDILVNDLGIDEQNIYRLQGGKAVEDLFTSNDFAKHVLQEPNNPIPNGIANSDFINKNQKIVLSQRFFEKYTGSKLVFEPVTKENFGKVFGFIRMALKSQ